jgi:SAM-dependent methyltransferase
MPLDIREKAASFYDLNPGDLGDLSFYLQNIPSPESQILELGCGTGRVLIPLAAKCGYTHGVDSSQAMLSICQEKLRDRGIPDSKAQVELGNITQLNLGLKFDLIIAPFRVFQLLETDGDVNGYFQTVRAHLAKGGSSILNVFRPYLDRARLVREWPTDEERLSWEVPIPGGKITCHDRRSSMDADKLILYPDLIYRQFEGERVVDEVVLPLIMRCFYPEEFERLIENHGFKVINKWGGYSGEQYGEGPELVVQFRMDA